MANQPNVALKMALFKTGKTQRQIARVARIAEQDISHAIRGNRDLDSKQRERLITVLKRHGVQASEAELFPVDQAIAS